MMEKLQLNETEFGKNRLALAEGLKQQINLPMVFVGNVVDALPPAARAELAEHTVDPSIYEGRTPLIAASYMQERSVVVMKNRPFDAEIEILSDLCHTGNSPIPSILSGVDFNYSSSSIATAININKSSLYFHPFIRTEKFTQSGVDARAFNDKALMRLAMKDFDMQQFLPKGDEVIYRPGESAGDLTSRIIASLSTLNYVDSARLKLASSASGMSTLKIDLNRFRTEEIYRGEIISRVPTIFQYDDQMFLGNVVIEENIDFGNDDGYSDFGIRGYMLPDGAFYTTSIGRVLCDDGVYRGMVMAQAEDLSSIGLNIKNFKQTEQALIDFSHKVYTNFNYTGPVNLDYFIDQSGVLNPLVHDFNMRDGGSSASGGFGFLISGIKPTADVDLRLKTNQPMSETEINATIRKLWENGIVTYSTTFLRFPTKLDGGNLYTLKVMAPVDNRCDTDENTRKAISSLANKVDHLIEFGQVFF